MNEPNSDKAWLLIVRSSNEGFNEYILKAGRNTLGRDEANDCFLHDIAASG